MGEYIFPTDLPVSSPYGPRDGGFHPGVDFSDGVAGHPIHAVADGVVTYKAYEEGGAGNTVTLTHPTGIKSGYMHMIAPADVDAGDRVMQGQVIGHVGTTGDSTGPHLHLWMGVGPNPPLSVDPLPLLSEPTPVTPPVLQQKVENKMWCAVIIHDTDGSVMNWCDVYYNGVLVESFQQTNTNAFNVGAQLQGHLGRGSGLSVYDQRKDYEDVRKRLTAAAA